MQSVPAYLEAVIKESMRKYPTAATVIHRTVTMEEGLKLDLSHLIGKYWITADNCSVTIPKNALITVSAFAVQNCTNNWGSDATDFIPERWLPTVSVAGVLDSVEPADYGEVDLEKDFGGNPLASAAIFSGGGLDSSEISFAPFSHGLRNCIGMNLALLEIRLTALQLVKNFTFELADNAMRDDRTSVENRFTLRPKYDLPILVKQRA